MDVHPTKNVAIGIDPYPFHCIEGYPHRKDISVIKKRLDSPKKQRFYRSLLQDGLATTAQFILWRAGLDRQPCWNEDWWAKHHHTQLRKFSDAMFMQYFTALFHCISAKIQPRPATWLTLIPCFSTNNKCSTWHSCCVFFRVTGSWSDCTDVTSSHIISSYHARKPKT